MINMVDQRTTATRDDLFSNLLKAREEEKGDSTVFSDSDLMGANTTNEPGIIILITRT